MPITTFTTLRPHPQRRSSAESTSRHVTSRHSSSSFIAVAHPPHQPPARARANTVVIRSNPQASWCLGLQEHRLPRRKPPAPISHSHCTQLIMRRCSSTVKLVLHVLASSHVSSNPQPPAGVQHAVPRHPHRPVLHPEWPRSGLMLLIAGC